MATKVPAVAGFEAENEYPSAAMLVMPPIPARAGGKKADCKPNPCLEYGENSVPCPQAEAQPIKAIIAMNQPLLIIRWTRETSRFCSIVCNVLEYIPETFEGQQRVGKNAAILGQLQMHCISASDVGGEARPNFPKFPHSS